MKKTVIKYVALTVLGIVLYRYCADLAYQHRGYPAVGGEIFMLFLPAPYHPVTCMARDVVNDCKELWKELRG